MERKSAWVPVLAAVLAAAAYLGALRSREQSLRQDYEPVNILSARTDLPERTLLRADLVEAVSVPRRFVSQDAIEVRSMGDLKLVTNQVTRVRVPKGNQILQSALLPLSPGAGVSTKVPPGYRASVVAVPRDLAKLVKVGDRVDILLTFDALLADNRREKVTATILQNVMVLGVGEDLGQGLSAPQHNRAEAAEQQAAAFSENAVLSLALNPLETQYMALCLRQGDIHVAVRGLGDTEMHAIPISRIRGLLGG